MPPNSAHPGHSRSQARARGRAAPESLSSPRRRSVVDLTADDYGDGDGELEYEEPGYRWMGEHARRMRDTEEAYERVERLRWQLQEELARAAGDPFAAYSSYPASATDQSGLRIPARYRAERSHHDQYSPFRSRRGMDEAPGHTPVPPLGSMSDEVYVQFVRDSFARRARAAETAAEEQRRAERLRQEREAERARATAEAERMQRKKERRRRRELEEQRAARTDEEGRAQQRRRWRERWGLLMGSGAGGGSGMGKSKARSGGSQAATEGQREGDGEDADADADDVLEIELQWTDVPWPVYASGVSAARPLGTVALGDFVQGKIKDFLLALAVEQPGTATRGRADDQEAYRKMLREAIRMYHPDRFFGRVLPRIRASERDRVKEGVELCSRIINDLAGAARNG